ncbi:MAG: AgmX/PglI C-terminal domain-containing protein [Bradymonadales bacterium]|nr:AgmX/PglI C-terminal domain-containing protein [Bradymonadales bacterium]
MLSKPRTQLPPPLPNGVACPDLLQKGTRVGGDWEIQEQIGQSEIARSFLVTPADQPDLEPVTLKLLHTSLQPHFERFGSTLEAAMRCQHRHLSRLLAFGLHADCPFLVLQYVRGQTLRHAIERKQAGNTRFSPRTALSLVTPVAQALTVVHREIPHAVVTPQNIYVERKGRVCLANLGFGWLVEQALHQTGRGALADSPFIAPEVRHDPDAATLSSDIFSLAMITISLLASRYPTLDQAEDLAARVFRRIPESLKELLTAALSPKAAERPETAGLFLDVLGNALEDLRDQIILERTGESQIISPAALKAGTAALAEGFGLAPSTGGQAAPVGLLPVSDLPPAPEDGEDPLVWLIHRDGFDYGPYNCEQVREQLLNDSIDEYSQIRNLETMESGLLGETSEFTEFVAEYIPVREERRHREALRRAEVQKKVKRASATGLITALIGLLGILGMYGYYIEYMRAKPQPILFETLFSRLDARLAPPNQSYVGIAADPVLMASLFNFEEEIPAQPVRRRRRSSTTQQTNGQPGSDQEEAYDPYNLGTIDFTQESGGRRLTADDINATIAQYGGEIQDCFRTEIRTNPRFGMGERLAIRFTIRPDGRPVGVGLEGGTYSEDLRTCLVRTFRSMQFAEHNELSLPVIYPFQIRLR